MKFLVLLTAFVLTYLLGRKVIVIYPQTLKSDWIRIKKSAAWVAAKLKAFKEKFTKNS